MSAVISFHFSFAVALLVAHCCAAPAPQMIVQAPVEHLEDSKIFNIRPLLMNAPKTQKNVKFSAATDNAQSGRTLTNSELFE